MKAWSPNHWTTREFPSFISLKQEEVMLFVKILLKINKQSLRTEVNEMEREEKILGWKREIMKSKV